MNISKFHQPKFDEIQSPLARSNSTKVHVNKFLSKISNTDLTLSVYNNTINNGRKIANTEDLPFFLANKLKPKDFSR